MAVTFLSSPITSSKQWVTTLSPFHFSLLFFFLYKYILMFVSQWVAQDVTEFAFFFFIGMKSREWVRCGPIEVLWAGFSLVFVLLRIGKWEKRKDNGRRVYERLCAIYLNKNGCVLCWVWLGKWERLYERKMELSKRVKMERRGEHWKDDRTNIYLLRW